MKIDITLRPGAERAHTDVSVAALPRFGDRITVVRGTTRHEYTALSVEHICHDDPMEKPEILVLAQIVGHHQMTHEQDVERMCNGG